MLLNLQQTAEKLSLTETSVKRLMEAGTLPNVPYGRADAKRRSLRFNEAVVRDIKRKLSKHEIELPVNLVSKTGESLIIPPGYINAKDAADVLGWKRQRVGDMLKHGRITGIKIGKRAYFSPEEIERAKAFPKSGFLRQRQHLSQQVDIVSAITGSNGNGAVTALPGFTALSGRLTKIENRLDAIDDKFDTLNERLDTLIKLWS